MYDCCRHGVASCRLICPWVLLIQTTFKQCVSDDKSHLSMVILNFEVNIFVWQNNEHDDCGHENQTVIVCCTITSCSFQRIRAIRQYDGHQRKQVAQQETSENQHLEKQEAGRKMKGIMWRKE